LTAVILSANTERVIPYEFSTPVETARLKLRLLTEADIDAVHSYQSRADFCQYMLYEPRDRDTVAAKVKQHVTRRRLENDGDYLELAVERQDDGTLLGGIYFAIKSAESDGAEIGWGLHPDHHGRGYAREAARAMLGIGFGEMDLHRVIAELDPRNHRSVALCLRLGMRKEAYFVEDRAFKGEWADTGIYAILAREFRELGNQLAVVG
jgi:RimJ/RimL family protein N-acetyltransferase